MTQRFLRLAGGIVGSAVLAACGGGGSTSPASSNSLPAVGSTSRSAQASAISTAASPDAPLLIHVGFTHAALKKSKYGPVAFYAPNAGSTKIITVKAGSSVAFINDDTSRHTAAGLGSKSFPKSFDNKDPLTQNGTTINGNLTWSTGILNPSITSQTFKVGPKGVYFFGCYYHYSIVPSMRDVIVSQ